MWLDDRRNKNVCNLPLDARSIVINAILCLQEVIMASNPIVMCQYEIYNKKQDSIKFTALTITIVQIHKNKNIANPNLTLNMDIIFKRLPYRHLIFSD